MKNKKDFNQYYVDESKSNDLFEPVNRAYLNIDPKKSHKYSAPSPDRNLAEILIIASYPPRECGIATYSQDLKKSLDNKFSDSLTIRICALENGDVKYQYPDEVKFTLDTSSVNDYKKLASNINNDSCIEMVLIQHEFGLFRKQEKAFLKFLYEISKPVLIAFHTVLPNPGEELKSKIKAITTACESIIVMTHNSAEILTYDYGVDPKKINVIAHGTHLVPHLSKDLLKQKYGFKNRKVLATFGLLSSGKGIETTIEALPAIVKDCPEVMFLVLGKTHPEVVKNDGETYRDSLEQKVKEYGLNNHVTFINKYLALPVLLEYLQLTDIYLFTANDPNQAVSGTFAYAMSCACPIISTPIPHAREVLTQDMGIIFDFHNAQQLAIAVSRLLNDEPLRKHLSVNSLQKIVSTAWENSAVAHAILFEEMSFGVIAIQYNLPVINMAHLKHMTTETGIIQFSKINQPDIESGYTLDDNARALVATCMNFKLTAHKESLDSISIYLGFIKRCLQPSGDFLNYVDKDTQFTDQNSSTNLDDSNGRAIWALGYLISLFDIIPDGIISEAKAILKRSLIHIDTVNSTRAMAFAIKGLYYDNYAFKCPKNLALLKKLADRLVQMFRHESKEHWRWFESYLTYANSILPEAMLYAWLLTKEPIYKVIAIASFNFLLSQTFHEDGIEVISNKDWLQKGGKAGRFGEQPIDVAYTIMTLGKFYDVFMDEAYREKMDTAFNWFLGKNHLHQIIYNPCTGGCYDGLEENNVNLNQGAESTVSYLMARLTMEGYKNSDNATQSNHKKSTYSEASITAGHTVSIYDCQGKT
ncbi:MAG: glycosyltransferase [Bacteroidales bacterium]|nr:glycosyltransferase [Bacteroidales bacterium]